MDERQKTRLVVLGISGVMMGAAYYAYNWYHEQKAAQAEEEQSVPVVSVRPKPVAQVAMTTPVGATPPATTASPASGSNTSPPSTSPKPTAVGATGEAALGEAAQSGAESRPPAASTTKKIDALPPPPVVAQIAPVVVPPVAPPAVKAPVVIPVKVKTPVPVPVATQQPAPKPVAQAPAPVATPVAKPVAVQPVQKPVVTPPVAQAPKPVAQPPAVAATPEANAAPAAAPAAVVATGKEIYLATTKDQATAAASSKKGNPEPTRPLTGFLPWPRAGAGAMLATKDSTAAMMALVPPPPPPGPPKPKKINEKLVPPPPPPEATGAPDSGIAGLPIDQLPVPPSRPTIGDKVRVLGVFDDRAIISFPKQLAIKNKWPKTITLGTGDQFESLTIVSINRDGVTIEEDGERTMKPIGAVK